MTLANMLAASGKNAKGKSRTEPMTNAAEASAAASRGEDVTFYHPSVGNVPASALNQIAAQVSSVGWNFADFEDLLNGGNQKAITNFMNRLNTGTLSAAAGAIVQSPKAPGGGLGKTPEVDKRRRLHQQQANVADKGNVKLQEATTNENILRVIINSPLALMEYLEELKASGDTVKFEAATKSVLNYYKGVANFRERLREEQQFVSSGKPTSDGSLEGSQPNQTKIRGASNKPITSGDKRHFLNPDEPEASSNTGTTAKGLYDAAPQPQPQPPQKRAAAPQPPQPNALGGRDNIKNVPREQISVLGKKLDVRQDYEYAGDQDDNRLEKDTRDPARTFRLAFANAKSGSVFEANGQKYRKY